MFNQISAVLLCLTAVVFDRTVVAEEPLALKSGQTVLFLGDSNTFAGKFIAYLDFHFHVRNPDSTVNFLNLGLPSETVSGLSEADHPYPRPNVHTRLANALARVKPNVVVACYGMNDGIYSPFDEGRFATYREGYEKLIADCEKAGAKVILMTPAPFDPKPLAKQVLPKGEPKYSWVKPYEHYDAEVLAKYSEWLLTLRSKRYIVADAHSAVSKHLERMRKLSPDYWVSGDGIHPDANGHFLIYSALADALGWKYSTGSTPVTVGANSLRLSLPFPYYPQWHLKLSEVESLPNRFGTARLQFKEAKVPYTLKSDDKLIVTGTTAEWREGIPLPDALSRPLKMQSLELFKLIEERQTLLGRAWLTHIGHNRPDTPKGLPLEEATRKAADLQSRIRKRIVPDQINVSLVEMPKR